MSFRSGSRPWTPLDSVSALLLAALLLVPSHARAQARQGAAAPGASPGAGASGSPRRHDADGRLLVDAAVAGAPVRVDGILDDAVWRVAEPVGDFVQSEPDEGAPATERTEVMVARDATTLYVAARLHDDHPDALVVNDLHKDFDEQDQDDFEVMLDTFGDRRNAYVFITNAAGARADRQVANEGRETNTSWDAAWTVRTRRDTSGWTVEMAIPLRALRTDAAVTHWGVNFARRIRRRNEVAYWSPVPRQYTITRVSAAGTLDGVGGAAQVPSRDVRIKPYVAERSVRELATGARYRGAADAGVDLKLGLTPGLTLDATVNPDFAQAEADEQQVNLTQFSQFFPEKREFFLENSGVFYVGDAARNRSGPTPTPDEDLLLFFSRRIGLTTDGEAVPLSGGVRLTGREGGFGVGALALRTHASATGPANDYAVIRVRRNLLAESDIGVVAMSRDAIGAGVADTGRYNRLAGADANLRLFGDWDWSSYAVRTMTPGVARGQYAYRTTMNHEGNFFHVKAGVLELGDGFRDDLGFYRRTDVRKWLLDTGLRPRPAWWAAHGVREIHPHATWDYYEAIDGGPVGKRLHTAVSFFFNDGGFTELSVNPRYEYLDSAFTIDDRVPALRAGGYAWTEYMWRLETDASRAASLQLNLTGGGLWSGTQRSVSATATFHPTYRLRLRGGVQRIAAALRDSLDSRFVATLYTARASYAFTTNMFLDGLVQYDAPARQVNTNVRFNLIHHPLSDLFIVLNEQRVSTPGAPPPGRSVIVKVTQMIAP